MGMFISFQLLIKSNQFFVMPGIPTLHKIDYEKHLPDKQHKKYIYYIIALFNTLYTNDVEQVQNQYRPFPHCWYTI